MAQGKLKTKVKVPSHHKQKHDRNKQKGPKRGGRVIAPKRAKLVQAAKLKKGLENTIRASIEQDASSRAAAVEPKSFHIIHTAKPQDSKPQNRGKDKGKQ